MPEGDTIFRTARTMNRVLAGRIVIEFNCVYPLVTRAAEQHAVVGRTIASVTSRGKHLLINFSGDLFLHTHMRMNGS
jgi:endonuclease VIII